MNQRGLIWIGAIGAIAALTIVIGVIAGSASTVEAKPCWDPGYTGGFSWLDRGQHQYGWHTAHASATPCTATIHSANCDCPWCAEHAAANSAAADCPCPWCTGAAEESAKDPAGWYGHGADCGCRWCNTYRSGKIDAAIGDYSHDAHCGCGWCVGHADVPDTDGAASAHGHGCCCGWCASHGATDGKAPAAPARSHCGCC